MILSETYNPGFTVYLLSQGLPNEHIWVHTAPISPLPCTHCATRRHIYQYFLIKN